MRSLGILLFVLGSHVWFIYCRQFAYDELTRKPLGLV